MGEAALHIVNARCLPHMAQGDEAMSEKEQGEEAFQPGFGRKHMKEHQKQRQRVLQLPFKGRPQCWKDTGEPNKL